MALILIRKIAELFCYMIMGFFLIRSHVLRKEDTAVITKLSINLIMPFSILGAFLVPYSADVLKGIGVAFLAYALLQAVVLPAASLYGKITGGSAVETASIGYSNVGNLVIPLVSFVLGQEWVIYTSAYIFVFNLLFWTVGIRMFERESAPGIGKILLNPNLLAVGAGLITLFTRLKLPEPVALAFSDVSAMVGPLSMMITGMMIGGMTFRGMFSNRRVFGVVFFRMILASGLAVFAAALVVRFLPVDRNIMMIILLGAMAPAASNINQVAILYNRDAGYASAINVLTTLSCIVTIPLWFMLYEALIG